VHVNPAECTAADLFLFFPSASTHQQIPLKPTPLLPLLVNKSPPVILPASCDFIIEHFNSKLKSSLDSVAPLIRKKLKIKPTPPWRNDEIRQLKINCSMTERKWRKYKLAIHY